MTRPAPPDVYHRRNHHGEFDTCWDCQRARAICRSKIPFDTVEAVDASVKELNEQRGYQRPVQRYPCRWCPGWHMKTARKKHDVKRAEKQRRKWLVSRRGSAYASKSPLRRYFDAPQVQPPARAGASRETTWNGVQRPGTR